MTFEIKAFSNLKDEYRQIAIVHSKCLPDDILPNLGMNFLENYYQTIGEKEKQIVFCVFVDEKIIGFCQVSYEPVSFARHILRKNNIKYLFKLSIAKPKLLMEGIIETFRKLFVSKPTSIPEITFIGILPEYQYKGIGTKLVSYILANVGNRECNSKMYTKTSNSNAKNMYINKFDACIEEEYKILNKKFWVISLRMQKRIKQPK